MDEAGNPGFPCLLREDWVFDLPTVLRLTFDCWGEFLLNLAQKKRVWPAPIRANPAVNVGRETLSQIGFVSPADGLKY